VIKIVLAGGLAVATAAVAGVAATGLVVVDVSDPGKGHHIIVPVPLVLAQTAAAFVPENKTRVHLDDRAARYLPMARDVLQALEEAEDAELVRVEEPGKQVSIKKEGSLLRIDVEDGDQRVSVQMPIALARSVLPEAGGRISASQAVWALQRARLTQVVDVQGKDGERVKITIY
jgi:hypothetical protein